MKVAIKIKPERMKWLKSQSLLSGAHDSPDKGACVMEAAAYVAGEPWSDHPECVCPIIGAFLRSWNDSLPDNATRDRLLKPLVKKIINTKATPKIEQQRGFMCVDWMIREFTPAWLEMVPSLKVHAVTLSASPEIKTVKDLLAITPVIVDIGKQAAAARDAARAAAWDAAWAAARDAAWDAARDAARDAAWNAARDALKPTTEKLQLSTVKLVERMANVR